MYIRRKSKKKTKKKTKNKKTKKQTKNVLYINVTFENPSVFRKCETETIYQ